MSDENTKGLTAEALVWGYRLFLDREPESQTVVTDKLKYLSSTQELRRELLGSDEYTSANASASRVLFSGNEPPLAVEATADLGPLFRHIQQVWEHEGETQPYWSVLTEDRFRTESIAETRDHFYQSGADSVATLLRTLERNGIDRSSLRSCLEYGCGTGRVTTWLAREFETVCAVDISNPHVEVARRYMNEIGQHNVTFRQMRTQDDIEQLPRVDVIYSLIVLQHNPPPIIEHIVRHLLRALNPGGIAYFQVPTYLPGYSFSLTGYMTGDLLRHGIETHLLPQQDIFELVHQEHGRVLEVFEDGWLGTAPGTRSNTFVVQKR